MIYSLVNIHDISEETYNKWFELIDTAKKARISRMLNHGDKKRSIAGDLTVKKLISDFSGINAEEIKLSADENGKPFPIAQNLHISISHSHDYVACAVSKTPIGIDIEKISPINLKVAKRFCNKTELKYIFGKAPSDDDLVYTERCDLLQRFYEVWTAKEAFCKKTGVGISVINEIEFSKIKVSSFISNGYYISICN